MKGLLLKDWYQLKKYCRYVLFICALFWGLSIYVDGNAFFTVYPCLLAGVIPTTLLSYDERDRWEAYSLTLPITRKQIVSAKYIIGLLLQGCTILLTLAFHGIKMALSGTFSLSALLFLLQVMLIASCPGIIALPIIFYLGAEKGRLITPFVIGAMAGILSFYSVRFDLLAFNNADRLPAVLIAIILIAYIFSWRLSVHFYETRRD